MKGMQREINEKYMISAFLAFFLIQSNQIGIGVLSFQRKIVERAGNDSWIAVIVAGIFIHIVLWMIFKILEKGNGDLITIHHDLFGKWIGGVLSMIWIVYFCSNGLIVMRAYIEIVQVWMFPSINVWLFSFVILALVYNLIIGGFRVVTGICFLGVVIPSYLGLTFLYPVEYTEFRNLLPVWNHSLTEILFASKDMVFSYLGIATLLMFYPYIKHPERSKKWAYGGNIVTILLYTTLMVLSLAYFSEAYLIKNIWPTLTMWKIVEMPFVERFEYIGISSWILVILPNICLPFWAASRGVRQLFKFSQRKALIGILMITLIVTNLIKEREEIELVNHYVSISGLYLITFYIPFLLAFSYLRFKNKKGG